MKFHKEKNFFKWIITKWHFWLLSIGWGIFSSYEYIILGYFVTAITTMIFWIIIMGLFYLIIFIIMRKINKYINKKVEGEVKSFKIKKE